MQLPGRLLLLLRILYILAYLQVRSVALPVGLLLRAPVSRILLLFFLLFVPTPLRTMSLLLFLAVLTSRIIFRILHI